MGTELAVRWAALGRLLRRAGPYVALEIVLPGGTLFALLLYLHRSGQLRDFRIVRAAGRALGRAGAGVFDQLAYVWRPAGAGPAAGFGGFGVAG